MICAFVEESQEVFTEPQLPCSCTAVITYKCFLPLREAVVPGAEVRCSSHAYDNMGRYHLSITLEETIPPTEWLQHKSLISSVA